MNKLRQTFVRWIHRVNWIGLAGVVLIVLAVAAHFFVDRPMQERLQQLQQESEAAKMAAENAVRRRHVVRPVSHRLNEFYQAFPAKEKIPDILETIYAAAAEQGIHLPQGDYKAVSGNAGKLSGYQISLPVRGSYAQVRSFVSTVLSEVPSMSLDELAFTRDTIGNAEVEAKVRLTVYTRSE